MMDGEKRVRYEHPNRVTRRIVGSLQLSLHRFPRVKIMRRSSSRKASVRLWSKAKPWLLCRRAVVENGISAHRLGLNLERMRFRKEDKVWGDAVQKSLIAIDDAVPTNGSTARLCLNRPRKRLHSFIAMNPQARKVFAKLEG